jgi:KaiC/GvpD/RAD55 family RecA-like ATPase
MEHGLEQFLDNIWGEEEGTVFFAQKKTEDLFRVPPPVLWPAQRATILSFISMSDANWDTYFTPGIFKEGSLTKEKENGWRAKTLWVDLDGYKDGLSAAEDALRIIRETGWLPEPTYRIQTSLNGEHWYWILDEYVDASVINNVNRRLTYFLNADKACWDISHVMRPPETHNHKDKHKVDGVSPQVSIAYFAETIHNIDTFQKLPAIKEQINDRLTFGDIPNVQDVLMKYPWDKTHIEVFKREKDHFWNEQTQDFESRGNAMVRLSYFGAEIGMSDEALYSVLLDVDNRWGKFKDRHDRQARLVEMISKVRLKYPHALITEYNTEETILKAVYGFTDFLATEYEFKWIYDNMVPENGINFISARPGVGKSRFILQMMMCLALGRDFLGWKLVGGPRKVLLMSLEMGPPVLKKFMQSMAKDAELTDDELRTLNENFLVVPAGEPLAISSPEGEQFFRKVVGDHNPSVVFIDAMGSLDIDELSEAVSKKIMSKLKGFLNEWDITFYMVHHNKKADAASVNKPPSLNDFYGNTYASTDAASIFALWQNPQTSTEEVELHTIKHRIGLAPAPLVLDSRSKFTFSLLETKDEQYRPSAAKPAEQRTTETVGEPDTKPFGFNF